MKKKLTEIFIEKYTTDVGEDAQKYYWYFDEAYKPIGISKEISDTERELIDLSYTSISMNNLNDTEKHLWQSFLFGEEFSDIPVSAFGTTTIKFIFLFHDFDTELQQEFETLVRGFNSQFKVCFIEPEYGVILEISKANTSEDDEVEDFLSAAIQDFSTKLTFYQTVSYEVDRQLPAKFKLELNLFKEFKDNNQALMKYTDIFLNYITSNTVALEHPIFSDWFKQLFLVDAELLAVVKCYLEKGFNVTTGAKAMHMHRNTFMNKLDRFIEMTGLDVKNFDKAVIAYLLIKRLY